MNHKCLRLLVLNENIVQFEENENRGNSTYLHVVFPGEHGLSLRAHP